MESVCKIKEFGSLDVTTPDNLKLSLQSHWKFIGNEVVSLDILIVCNDTLWEGSIGRWTLEEKARDLNLLYCDYCDSLKNVMVSPWGPKNDTLSFKDGVLSWQKIVKSGAFISFGDFNFTKIEDTGLLANTISSLLDSNRSMQEVIQEASARISIIQKGWDDCELYADKMVKMKHDMERNLYSQFVAVLNAKKRRLND